jgi:CBS domain containing-hemolysin-like protein
MTAEDVVTEDLETIDPDSDVEEAMELMSQRQIRRLPVVDNGELIGMISLGDIAVKQDDQQGSGHALQQVSQGVKKSYPPLLPQRRAFPQSEPEMEMEIESPALGFPPSNSGQQVRQSRVLPFRSGGDRGGKKSSKDKAS